MAVTLPHSTVSSNFKLQQQRDPPSPKNHNNNALTNT